MKIAFYSALIVASMTFLAWNNQAFAAEAKKVCHETKNKAGKTVQDCKTVKVHKKLDTKPADTKK
jgi:hypothetical protein